MVHLEVPRVARISTSSFCFQSKARSPPFPDCEGTKFFPSYVIELRALRVCVSEFLVSEWNKRSSWRLPDSSSTHRIVGGFLNPGQFQLIMVKERRRWICLS